VIAESLDLPRDDYGFVKCRPARRILSHAAKFQY
jgi:hypothetical protein